MKPTWIYLIKDERTNYTKIGWTTDVQRRLRQLHREPVLLPEPHKFTLIQAWKAPRKIEVELHREYSAQRVRGEWFDLSEQDIEDIEEWFYWEYDRLDGFNGFRDYCRHFTLRILQGRYPPDTILEDEFAIGLRELVAQMEAADA